MGSTIERGKMVLITDINTNRIIHIAKSWKKENGQYIITLNNNEEIAFGCPINIFKRVSVTEEVITEKYCYTKEEGFTLNKDYVEPEVTEVTESEGK